MRTRAYYRHQHYRAARKARRIVERVWRVRAESVDQVTQGMVRQRRKCSCLMCSRSRRVLGPSVQEMRQPQWVLSWTSDGIGTRVSPPAFPMVWR